jgi:hypothetical protein
MENATLAEESAIDSRYRTPDKGTIGEKSNVIKRKLGVSEMKTAAAARIQESAESKITRKCGGVDRNR